MSPYRYLPSGRLASFLFAALLCLRSGAGGGPLNTLVLVNLQDPESPELGAYYAAQRGIPQTHIVRLSLPVTEQISPAVFTNQMVQPMLDHLQLLGLDAQIDFAAIAWKLPFRTAHGASNNEYNSLTSALLYGVKSAPLPGACNLTANASSPVHEADQSFATLRPTLPGRPFAAAMITGTSAAGARALVDRSIAADFSQPAGTVHLLHTSDNFRNVQWPLFDSTAMAVRMTPAPLTVLLEDRDKLSNTTDVAGYYAGLVSHQPEAGTNTYVPGALAHHLTSFGGRISDSLGQMNMLDWIAAGASGTAGTVDEPCNYTNKFPSARLYLHHARGYALAESFLQSTTHPYQTLVVGDPICQPYAVPPNVTLGGATNTQVVAGTLPLNLSAQSPVAGVRIGRIEFFIDGRKTATPIQKGPTPGNRVTAVVNGTNRRYTVQAGDTLKNVAAGLAAAVGVNPAFGKTARGDHVEIRQAATGQPGAGLTLSTLAEQMSASELTLSARPSFPAFLESDRYAREELEISGTPTAGDTVKAVVTLAAGLKVTNTVTAVSGSTAGSLMTSLAGLINGSPALQGAAGCTLKYLVAPVSNYCSAWLVANAPGYGGARLQVAYTITSTTLNTGSSFTDVFNDNASATVARNVVWLSAGGDPLAGTHYLDTTTLPDGPHLLSAVGVEGTAVEAQGTASVTVIVDNHPGEVAITHPSAGSFVVEGRTVQVAVSAASPAGVAATNLLVRGVAQAGFAVNTGDYGAGEIELQALMTDGLGRETVSAPVRLTVLADHDDDGLPDDWEIQNFTSLSAQDGDNDPDADGQDNLFEFVAGTQPTNSTSRLTLAITNDVPAAEFSLVFPGRPDRRYTVEHNPSNSLPVAAWAPVPPARFAGTNAVHRWTAPPALQHPPGGWGAFRLSVELP